MKKILVIDEDISFFKAFQEMFSQRDVFVIKATTGQEGLGQVEREKPNIILLDVMLPGGINGFDVLENLKRNEKTKNIPVIMMTNLDSEAKVAKTIGAVDYLTKSNTTKDKIVELVMKHLQSTT